MFSILSALIGEMKLWKAVLIFAAIVALAAWGIISKRRPQTIDRGTWTIEPGGFEGSGISLSREAKLEAEFTAAPGHDIKYTAMVLTFQEMLRVPTAKPGEIRGIARQESTAAIKLGPIRLEPDQYSITVLNRATKPLTLTYKFSAKRQ